MAKNAAVTLLTFAFNLYTFYLLLLPLLLHVAVFNLRSEFICLSVLALPAFA